MNVKVIPLIMAIALLAGCSTGRKVDALQNEVNRKVEANNEKSALTTPIVTTSDSSWIAGPSIKVPPRELPILKEDVTYHSTSRVTLSDVTQWITAHTGLVVDIANLQHSYNSSSSSGSSSSGSSSGGSGGAMGAMGAMGGMGGMGAMGGSNSLFAPPESMYGMTVDYSGSLAGLLNVLANKSSCWWHVVGGKVSFYVSITKTFYLPALARQFTATNTISSSMGGSSSGGGSSGSAGASSGSSSTSSGGMSSSGGSENSSTYAVNIWKDISTQAKVVAAGARVAVNESAGSITVTGTPAQVRYVRDWVKQLSDQMSQQVAITVRIYNVKVTNEDNYSWNPSVLFKSAKGILNLAATGVQAPAILSGLNPANVGVSLVSNAASGQTTQLNGSKLAFNALSSLGHVTEKISQTIVTLNGQPAPMQIANMQGYLASTTQTVTANVGASTALIPGMVTAGFTATFIPRILNGKVYLSMTMDNSTNNGFNTISSNGSTIMTPNIDSDSFQQSVALTPGDALMLTGLQRDEGSRAKNGVGAADNYLLGGGSDNQMQKEIVAVVITAKVL